MKPTNTYLINLFYKLEVWLLSLTGSLVTIYISLLWQSQDIAHLGMSGLVLLVVGYRVWEKRHKLKLESSILFHVIGLLLISWIVINLPLYPENDKLDPFLRSTPFIFALGLNLIGFGLKGFKLYWQELTILFFLGVPSLITSWLKFDPSVMTAQFSAFILWCINLNPVREGVYIYLSSRAVEVNKGCSGLEAMTYLLGISVMMLIMFPLKRIYNIIVPIVAVSVAFIFNGLRVVLLTLLAASNKIQAFKYWYEEKGALIVGIIAIAIFLGFYSLLIRSSHVNCSDSIRESQRSSVFRQQVSKYSKRQFLQ